MGVGSGALRRSSTASMSRRRGWRRAGGPSGSDGDRTAPDSPGTGPRHLTNIWLILVVAGVIALGIGLRFFARSDLWADEVLTVNIAKLPLADLEGALRHDGAPPLYYVLLHFWMQAFGT